MDIFSIKFKYDALKSKRNQEKHGISLEEAKALWAEPGIEIQARTVDESRFLRIGKLGAEYYSCVFTIREHSIRLISARRSRINEEKIYEEKIENEKAAKKNQGE